jgi:outer membrane protein assembly factor BamA
LASVFRGLGRAIVSHKRETSLLAMLTITSAAFIAPAVVIAREPRVVSVSISGNTHVPTDQILAALHTRPGEPYKDEALREDMETVAKSGYFNNQITPTIRHRPGGGIAVAFNVVENPVVRKVLFRGDTAILPETLVALMDTVPGNVLNMNTFRQDVVKINAYYDRMGYSGQVPSHVVDVNIDQKTGVLTLQILEGLQIRHVLISSGSDPVLPWPMIQQALSVKPGVVYSDASRQKDQDAVKDLFQKHDLQLGDFSSSIVPGSVDTKTETADIAYTIDAARIAAVQITGNTKTRDYVIRRVLRLRAGDLVTQSGIRRDYERISNLGFFEHVDLQPKPGPDPARPQDVVLDWSVKEARTGTATIGAGYSGGLTGQGLTGNLGYSESNVNGTGNTGSVRFERGAQVSDVELSASVPYLGDSPRAQKYSLAGSIFFDTQTNYYPVYATSSAQNSVINPSASSCAGALSLNAGIPGSATVNTGAQCPVQLIPNGTQIGGVVSTYNSRNDGVTATLGRRLSDYVTASVGTNISRIASNASVPLPYYFPNSLNGISTSTSGALALGITAPSIAQIGSGGYDLRSITLGLASDTRDDIFNPRRGYRAQLSDEVSAPSLGSYFEYSLVSADVAKFIPVGKLDTLGFHALLGKSTGAIPANKLYTFSDQQLRGYNDVFYGTDVILLQSEFRLPITSDKHFSLATFAETGATRIRGAATGVDSSGYLVDYGSYTWHGDAGFGLRFDLPQLGFRSIRLDFAHGNRGNHTSFGIGQSF